MNKRARNEIIYWWPWCWWWWIWNCCGFTLVWARVLHKVWIGCWCSDGVLYNVYLSKVPYNMRFMFLFSFDDLQTKLFSEVNGLWQADQVNWFLISNNRFFVDLVWIEYTEKRIDSSDLLFIPMLTCSPIVVDNCEFVGFDEKILCSFQLSCQLISIHRLDSLSKPQLPVFLREGLDKGKWANRNENEFGWDLCLIFGFGK